MKQLYRKMSRKERRELQQKLYLSIRNAFKEPPKDFIVNTYLQVLNRWRYIFKYKRRNFIHVVRNKYDLKVKDKFKDLSNWHKNLWWGQYSESETVSYYDKTMVTIEEKGCLLTYKKSPKLNEFSGRMMNWKTGNIQSLDTFGYGAFEVVCRIIPGEGVWHAPLWMVTKGSGEDGEYTVLPEPDVCEFYTDDKIKKFKANTNVHFGESYDKKDHRISGARSHWLRNVYNRDVSFAMIWQEKFIEMYYDGYLVRRITDKRILKKMNDLSVIIGAGVKKGNEVKYIKEGGGLLVKSFKFWD